MVSVEGESCVVLRIDYECEDGDFGTRSARRRIPEQRAAELSAVEARIDRQAAEPCHGDEGVAWQPLDEFGGHRVQWDAGSCQRVVADDIVRVRLQQNVAGANTPPHILRYLLPEIAVQRLATATEFRAVVPIGKRLDAEAFVHRGVMIKRS